MNQIIPVARCPVLVRLAVPSDLPFIDSLQKLHANMVGWMPTKQLEGKIGAGQVLLAEEPAPDRAGTTRGPGEGERLGYCIGHDQYFKRDDVGIIYQLNVLPMRHRSLVGATLLKAIFERSAWGCKLFCCWCAQDIQANYFWESMGFVPLAFRTGSAKRSRTHIFWQRRIRAGDETTPYWFPSKTSSGSIREDRIVLPIPPGTHWSDAKPLVLPAVSVVEGPQEQPRTPGSQLPDQSKRREPKSPKEPAIETTRAIAAGGLRLIAQRETKSDPKPSQKVPRVKVKNDPKLVAAARELRDRWLDHANAHPEALLSHGKYDVSRTLSTADGSRQMAADPSVKPLRLCA